MKSPILLTLCSFAALSHTALSQVKEPEVKPTPRQILDQEQAQAPMATFKY